MTKEQAQNVIALGVEYIMTRDVVDVTLVPNLEAAVEKAKKEGQDQITLLSTRLDTANEQIKTLNEQIATLTKDLADETAKCNNMEGHPDVVAARKTAAIAKAQDELAAGTAAVEKATRDLDSLGKKK